MQDYHPHSGMTDEGMGNPGEYGVKFSNVYCNRMGQAPQNRDNKPKPSDENFKHASNQSGVNSNDY